jgi:MFS family permease
MAFDKMIIFLTLINLLQNAGVSQTGPFYPLEASKKGVPDIYMGFIIGSFSIVYIISSVITGKNLTRIGRPRGLKFGLLFIVVQMLMLGAISFVDSVNMFIGLSFTAQIIGGIGAGLNSTCALAIINSFFPGEREFYIGILEAGVGIGMLIGPVVGAFLY